MDVGTVDHAIEVAEALAEGFADLDAANFMGVDGIHHEQVIGEYRAVTRGLAGPLASSAE